MTVINLHSRTTDNEQEFQKQKFSQASFLQIDEHCVIERFALELSVGNGWSRSYSTRNRELIRIGETGITIGRHDSVVVEVLGKISVPNNMYGILVPTGSLFLGHGILVAPAKIEPAFTGRLKLRLFNTTGEKYTLHRGTKLGSAVFFPTETTTHHPTTFREGEITEVTPSKLNRFVNWARRNPATWIGWLVSLVGGSLSAALVSYFILVKADNRSHTAAAGQSQTR